MLIKVWGRYDGIFEKAERFGLGLLVISIVGSPIALIWLTNPLFKITGAAYLCVVVLSRMFYVTRKELQKMKNQQL